MKYSPYSVCRWDGPDGILVCGQEYVVWNVREGKRGQEFTLKHKDRKPVKPEEIWWENGAPFKRPLMAAGTA